MLFRSVTNVRNETVGDKANVILLVDYVVFGTDENNNVGMFNNTLRFDRDSVEGADLVPFDQITEDMVLGWITDHVPESTFSNIDDMIRSQINVAKEQAMDSTIPWLPKQEVIVPKDPIERTKLMQKWAQEQITDSGTK